MNRRMFLGVAAALILSIAVSGSASALTQWQLLGSREVDITAQQDTIPVTILEGVFTHIRLTVLGNTLRIFDFTVVYGDGASENFHVRARIPAGGSTRDIALAGGTRIIHSVELTYRRPLLGGPTTVEVWGGR
jgi:hypothetical protein